LSDASATAKRRPRAISELDRRTCDLDRRSLEFKRYEEVRCAVIADLGGEDAVSTAEAQITDKAAFIAMTLETMQITALSGEQIDLQRYGELTDRLRRLFEAVGFSRRQRNVTPTLSKFVDGIARQQPSGGVIDNVVHPEPEIQSQPASGDANANTEAGQ
jgi:hypothetical protein